MSAIDRFRTDGRTDIESWQGLVAPVLGLLFLAWMGISGILGAALELHPQPGESNIPLYTPALRREVKALQSAARELREAVQDAQAIEAIWHTGDTSLTSPAIVLQDVYGRYDHCSIWTLRLCQALYLSAQATFMAVASPDPQARAEAELLIYTVRHEALAAEQRLLGHPQAAAARLGVSAFRVPFAQPRVPEGNPLVPQPQALAPTPEPASQLDITSERLLRTP